MLVMLAILACFRGGIVVVDGRSPCAGVATWTVVGGTPSDVRSLEGLVLDEPGELELCVEGAHARVEVRAPGVAVTSRRDSGEKSRLLGTASGEVIWVAPGASVTLDAVEVWSVVGGIRCEAGSSAELLDVVVREDVEEEMPAPLLSVDGCAVQMRDTGLLSERAPLLRLTGGATVQAEAAYLYGGGKDECAWVEESEAWFYDSEWAYCGLSMTGASAGIRLRKTDLFRSSWQVAEGLAEIGNLYVTESALSVTSGASLSWRQTQWYDSVVLLDGDQVQVGGYGEIP